MDFRGNRPLKAAMLALAATAAGLLGSGQGARADFFNFSPTGAGGTTYSNITGLQYGAGNAVGIGAIPLTPGVPFQVYFQTHLIGLVGTGAPGNLPNLNGPGPNGYQITMVATLSESVAPVNGIVPIPGVGTTANFVLNPAGVNQIKIYYNPSTVYNDATGTGFTTGQVIATITPTTFTSSSFLDKTQGGLPNPGTPTFAQAGGGNGVTKTADVGGGNTGFNSVVVSLDKNFFNPPNGSPLLTSSIFNSNLSTVFDAIAASLHFSSPVTNSQITDPVLGVNNGTSGPDIQFQVSGFTQSFSVVPEPASMTLIGLGLVGVVAYARRGRPQLA